MSGGVLVHDAISPLGKLEVYQSLAAVETYHQSY
jgi:hypothetical protein